VRVQQHLRADPEEHGRAFRDGGRANSPLLHLLLILIPSSSSYSSSSSSSSTSSSSSSSSSSPSPLLLLFLPLPSSRSPPPHPSALYPSEPPCGYRASPPHLRIVNPPRRHTITATGTSTLLVLRYPRRLPSLVVIEAQSYPRDKLSYSRAGKVCGYTEWVPTHTRRLSSPSSVLGRK